jgi:hypothetical protein
MNISDLVAKLQEIKDNHGDLPVTGDYGDIEVSLIKECDTFETCLYIG